MPPVAEGAGFVEEVTAGADPIIRRHCHLQCLGEILNVDLGKVEKFLITAVLISFLSGSVDLATLYLIAQRPARSSHPGQSVEQVLMAVWDELLDDDIFAVHCVLELVLPSGPLMLKAERFVMESILVRRILDACRLGVTMPLGQVIEQYLDLWLLRPSCHGSEPWLTRLAHHVNARRKFGVRLRSVWNLHWGSLRTITSVDEQQALQKATCFGGMSRGISLRFFIRAPRDSGIS